MIFRRNKSIKCEDSKVSKIIFNFQGNVKSFKRFGTFNVNLKMMRGGEEIDLSEEARG